MEVVQEQKDPARVVAVRAGEVIFHPTKQNVTYRVGKLLGVGGSASCHVLVDVRTGKRFAGKMVMKTNLVKPRTATNFQFELDIHSQVKHEHIVDLMEWFELADKFVLVLELCEGKTLREFIQQRGALPEHEVQRFGLQLLSALQYLHVECKVVHGDLKMSNVLLTANMQVKLVDFGLARRGDTDTVQMRLGGTAHYMAPEVVLKRGDSYEVDVWAFGIVLYGLIAGRPPFDAPTIKETFTRIANLEYTFPAGFPAKFQDLIASILQRNPHARPTWAQISAHACFEPSSPLPFPPIAVTAVNEILACHETAFGVGVAFTNGLVSVTYKQDGSRICWPLGSTQFLFAHSPIAATTTVERYDMDNYLSFPLHLKQRVNLHISMRAQLLGIAPNKPNDNATLVDDYLIRWDTKQDTKFYLSQSGLALAVFKNGAKLTNNSSSNGQDNALTQWLKNM